MGTWVLWCKKNTDKNYMWFFLLYFVVTNGNLLVIGRSGVVNFYWEKIKIAVTEPQQNQFNK